MARGLSVLLAVAGLACAAGAAVLFAASSDSGGDGPNAFTLVAAILLTALALAALAGAALVWLGTRERPGAPSGG